MAALAKDRNTPVRPGDILVAGVKKGAKIHAGSLVAKAAGGYAVPATKAQNLVVLGRAEQAVTGGAADGDVTVEVRRGTFRWANAPGGGAIDASLVGEQAHILDDQTVTKTAAGSTPAGKIVAVDSDGVWVETR